MEWFGWMALYFITRCKKNQESYEDNIHQCDAVQLAAGIENLRAAF